MPELPEVDTVSKYLDRRIRGKTVTSVKVNWSNMLGHLSKDKFAKKLNGQCIEKVSRRGKYIVCNLNNGERLIFHLRMSGNIEVEKSTKPPSKYHRITIGLNNGRELRFHDTRKFGRVYYEKGAQSILSKLGPEPFDASLTAARFFDLLQQKKRVVKSLLLDQSFIAGLGNIYVDESLWLARISPQRISNSLSAKESSTLLIAIRKTLMKALNAKGTDFGDGVAPYGVFRPRVYGREGRNCQRCGGMISKIRLGQRGTHFCGCCQIG